VRLFLVSLLSWWHTLVGVHWRRDAKVLQQILGSSLPRIYIIPCIFVLLPGAYDESSYMLWNVWGAYRGHFNWTGSYLWLLKPRQPSRRAYTAKDGEFKELGDGGPHCSYVGKSRV
jgi:hypothetical protein